MTRRSPSVSLSTLIVRAEAVGAERDGSCIGPVEATGTTVSAIYTLYCLGATSLNDCNDIDSKRNHCAHTHGGAVGPTGCWDRLTRVTVARRPTTGAMAGIEASTQLPRPAQKGKVTPLPCF